MKRNIIIFKCFIQFTCTNLDGSKKEGPNFYRLLQKEEDTQMGGRGGGLLRKRAGGEGGVATLEETMEPCQIYKMERFAKIVDKTLEFRSLKGF